MVLSAFLVEIVGIELLRPQLSQMSHASLGTGHYHKDDAGRLNSIGAILNYRSIQRYQ